jgi:hypothetical protein
VVTDEAADAFIFYLGKDKLVRIHDYDSV